MVKRFTLEKSDKKVLFLPEGNDFKLELVSSDWLPVVKVNYRKRAAEEVGRAEEFRLEELITVKGVKAKGNRLTSETVNTIDLMEPIPYEPPVVIRAEQLQDIAEDGIEEEGFDDDEGNDNEDPSSNNGSATPSSPKPERPWSPGGGEQLPLF